MDKCGTGLPSVQLARKGAVLGLTREVTRHHSLNELGSIANDEGPTVGKPADSFLVGRVAQNLHELLRAERNGG